MAKVESKKVTKVNKSKVNTELPVSNIGKELDLSIADIDLDIENIFKEPSVKIRVGPIFFPGDEFVAGQEIEGVFVGMIPMRNEEEGNDYEAVVLVGINKERFVCPSMRAVEDVRKAGIPVGGRTVLRYEGDIRTKNGKVMRKIMVSYYKKK